MATEANIFAPVSALGGITMTIDQPHAYVCDLDGTLLRSDATLSTYARDGLNALLDEGLSLTVASARSTAAMRILLHGLRLTLPVIELNGAFLTDLATGHHLAHRVLDPAAVTVAMDALEVLGIEPVLTTWNGTADHVSYGNRPNNGTSWYIEEKRAYGDPRLRPSADLRASAAGVQVASIVAFVPDAQVSIAVAALEEVLGSAAAVTSTANFYVPGWHEVQIAHPAANKGTAIKQLLDVTGRADALLTVFGDHLNDLPMFAIADCTVAPANAHPAVRSLATHVTATNDEDGVVRFLLQKSDLEGGENACL